MAPRGRVRSPSTIEALRPSPVPGQLRADHVTRRAARDVLSSELTRHRRRPQRLDRAGAGPYPWAPFATRGSRTSSSTSSTSAPSPAAATSTHRLGDVRAGREQVRLHPGDGLQLHQPLPVQEFAMDRSWGYNPARSSPRSRPTARPPSCATSSTPHTGRAGRHLRRRLQPLRPRRQRALGTSTATRNEGGIYFEGGQDTPWGRGPAWWKREVQDYFYQNARMYLEEYRADGLRFDVTTQINGDHLSLVVDRLRDDFPDKLPHRRAPARRSVDRQRGPVLRHLGRRRPPREPAGAGRAGSGEQGPRRARAGTATTTPGTW